MNKVKYILRCIRHLNFANMFKIINKISKKSGKNKFLLFIDVVYSGLVYGAGYYDYQEFEFYNIPLKKRKEYLTRTKNNLIIKTYNNRNYFDRFDDKGIFNALFKDYLKRDYLIINDNYDEFVSFVNKHNEFIAKPINGEGGKGVEKIITNDNLREVYDDLIKKNETLLEELIIQNDTINSLYSGSVNSLRLFTFFDGENGYVLNSVFKLGNGGVTDNFSSGSMYTFLSNEGVVMVPAIDQDDNIFDKHPITNKEIIGFEIPYYKEACELVISASKVVSEVKYVGWDVAITNDGPVIIEGNSFPGVFQIKPSLMKDMGLVSKYKKYMDVLK